MSEQVSVLERGPSRISMRTVVGAPPSAVFELLRDPHRHHEIDGSGTVMSKVKGPHELAEGSRFTVAMEQYRVPYRITSRVTAFEPDRLLEWRHPAGHRWRWELEPTPDGGTQVTETWDATRTPARFGFRLAGIPAANASGISRTLDGLRQRFA